MTTREKLHWHIKIVGHVQGVHFRQHVYTQAQGLGVTGYAQNNPDGSVTIEAEGDADSLREFIDLCSIGSQKAKVYSVEIEEGGLAHFDDFRVR